MVKTLSHTAGSQKANTSVKPGARLLILYVGKNAAYFAPILNNDDIQLDVVENSLQAINRLKSNDQPDAIVCDYYLPGKNGLYLFEQMRKVTAYDRIPFILLSEQFDNGLFALAFHKKVDDFYVHTSTTPENLLGRIKSLYEFRTRTTQSDFTADDSETFVMPLSKRLFDITVASLILLVASPFLLLIIIAIRLESKGKIYYTSKRVGRRVFDFYKLRSMRTGADNELKQLAKEKNQYNNQMAQSEIGFNIACPRCSELPDGQSCSPIMYVDKHSICDYWYNVQKGELSKHKSAFVKIANDPRVTRIGKFIRNTSIDELPQLINVIKGDMSLVGNRPLPVYEAELLTVDTLSKRFLAPAGITGLWQVELRGRGGKMSEDERKRLDNEYADHFRDGHYSFWYDMKLILRTIPALLQKNSV